MVPSKEKEENNEGVTAGNEDVVLIPRWRAIQSGVMPVKEDIGQTVTPVEAQVSQNQQCVLPPVLQMAPVSQPSKPSETHPGYDEGPGMIRYGRVEVLNPGGSDGGAWAERLETTPHVERSSQHVRG